MYKIRQVVKVKPFKEIVETLCDDEKTFYEKGWSLLDTSKIGSSASLVFHREMLEFCDTEVMIRNVFRDIYKKDLYYYQIVGSDRLFVSAWFE